MLVEAPRRAALAETAWAEYQVETIRLRLLKIAALVRHRAKDLDPLYEGLPMEAGLRLGLGSSTLLKNPKPKTPPLVAQQKAAARLKYSSKANPDWLPDRKTNIEQREQRK